MKHNQNDLHTWKYFLNSDYINWHPIKFRAPFSKNYCLSLYPNLSLWTAALIGVFDDRLVIRWGTIKRNEKIIKFSDIIGFETKTWQPFGVRSLENLSYKEKDGKKILITFVSAYRSAGRMDDLVSALKRRLPGKESVARNQ